MVGEYGYTKSFIELWTHKSLDIHRGFYALLCGTSKSSHTNCFGGITPLVLLNQPTPYKVSWNHKNQAPFC